MSQNYLTLRKEKLSLIPKLKNSLETPPNNAIYIAKYFRKEWEKVLDSEFEVSPLSGGITNTLYKCKRKQEPEIQNTILIRKFGKGTDLFLDREKEIAVMSELHKQSLSAECLGVFENGMCYSFLPGVPLKAQEMKKEYFMKMISHELKRWHSATLTTVDRETNCIFESIYKWIPRVNFDWLKDQSKKKEFVQIYQNLPQQIKELEEVIKKVFGKKHYVCAHNDLLCGNILYDQNDECVRFIDYEYAGYTYASYDVANHFNEMAGEYFDWSQYPSKEEQLFFISHYLSTQDSMEIENFYQQVCIQSLVSNIYWGIWGFLQCQYSVIDFDFISYTSSRFKGYYLFKSSFLHEQNL